MSRFHIGYIVNTPIGDAEIIRIIKGGVTTEKKYPRWYIYWV